VYDDQLRGGIHANVNQVHGLAWLLRDRLSTDSWRVLSRLDQEFEAPRPASRSTSAARSTSWTGPF